MNWRSIGRWTYIVFIRLVGALLAAFGVFYLSNVGETVGWEAVHIAVTGLAFLGMGLLAISYGTIERQS